MQENVNHEVTVDVEVPTDHNVIAVENGVDMSAKYPTEYAWVPFFKELANTIRSYKDNHQGLIDILGQVSKDTGIDYTACSNVDIDPFTFFASINRTLNIDKKIKLLNKYKEKMNLTSDVPEKLNGVPERQSLGSWFTDDEPRRNSACESVNDLWELFDAAIELEANRTDDNKRNDFCNAFTKCIKNGKHVGWGATYGLFWIRPEFYVGLDTNTRTFLTSKGFDIPDNYSKFSAEDYLKISEDVRNWIDNENVFGSVYELSDYAYSHQNVTVDAINNIFSTGFRQIVLTGAPGTGKTFSARQTAEDDIHAGTITTADKTDSKYQFVQFHPSYDYSDFIEGLRPVQLTKDGSPTFVKMDGTFKAFCRSVVKNNDDRHYYFIIDEINRADLSKVFGELMYCLEYRGPNYKMKTQYSNLKTYVVNDDGLAVAIDDDCFKDGFYIPQNVYIIGTMNDIDRSVESFDFALRRRFKWIEVKVKNVKYHILKHYLRDDHNCDEHVETLIAKLDALNDYISSSENNMGLSDAYHIGPAYFKGLENSGSRLRFETRITQIYNDEIETILKEYVRGRDQSAINEFLDAARKAFESNG
jgi:5-methylcytosine-specific restriction protein B